MASDTSARDEYPVRPAPSGPPASNRITFWERSKPVWGSYWIMRFILRVGSDAFVIRENNAVSAAKRAKKSK